MSYTSILKVLLHRSYKLICHQSEKSNLILSYSFCWTVTLVCILFAVKFVIILAFSPHKKIKRTNRNTTKTPLSKWKMLQLIQILQPKTYKLMWQEYDWWHLNSLINECLNNFFTFIFISDMLVCKTYFVSITCSLN